MYAKYITMSTYYLCSKESILPILSVCASFLQKIAFIAWNRFWNNPFSNPDNISRLIKLIDKTRTIDWKQKYHRIKPQLFRKYHLFHWISPRTNSQGHFALSNFNSVPLARTPTCRKQAEEQLPHIWILSSLGWARDH